MGGRVIIQKKKMRSKSKKKVNLLEICKTISKMNKKSQMDFIKNIKPKTIDNISEIFYNMQYLTNMVPAKKRKKLICGMKNNSSECIYISNKNGKKSVKKAYLRKQVGTGILSMILSAAIPILGRLISSLIKK